MDYDSIFAAYYTQYRAEATTPSSTDDEYVIGMRLANEAIRRWANYDGMYWQQLFTTAQTNSTGGVVTTTAGVQSYAAPTAMKEVGGYVKLLDSSGVVQRHIPIKSPEEVQFLDDMGTYAYFTGNPNTGFTLHLSPEIDTTGLLIDYVYYKNPTELTTGTDKPDMSNPDFIVHRMLANRFRASRNPYYTSALRDAEAALAGMKMDNDSGSWANPWQVPDNSGTTWGSGSPGDWAW